MNHNRVAMPFANSGDPNSVSDSILKGISGINLPKWSPTHSPIMKRHQGKAVGYPHKSPEVVRKEVQPNMQPNMQPHMQPLMQNQNNYPSPTQQNRTREVQISQTSEFSTTSSSFVHNQYSNERQQQVSGTSSAYGSDQSYLQGQQMQQQPMQHQQMQAQHHQQPEPIQSPAMNRNPVPNAAQNPATNSSNNINRSVKFNTEENSYHSYNTSVGQPKSNILPTPAKPTLPAPNRSYPQGPSQNQNHHMQPKQQPQVVPQPQKQQFSAPANTVPKVVKEPEPEYNPQPTPELTPTLPKRAVGPPNQVPQGASPLLGRRAVGGLGVKIARNFKIILRSSEFRNYRQLPFPTCCRCEFRVKFENSCGSH